MFDGTCLDGRQSQYRATNLLFRGVDGCKTDVSGKWLVSVRTPRFNTNSVRLPDGYFQPQRLSSDTFAFYVRDAGKWRREWNMNVGAFLSCHEVNLHHSFHEFAPSFVFAALKRSVLLNRRM